ncbi:MAG: hypothetical protein ACRDPA_00800, partial [Solirubrobacteraceae bacterium]
SLVNIIRGTGATNVIQLPGLAYANMVACSNTGNPVSCGFLDAADGVRVTDPMFPTSPQLMADMDVYPDANQDCDTPTCYNDTMAPVMANMPLDLGEIGPNGSTTTNTQALLTWMDSKGGSYYAWVWDTWGSLISNYNGSPDSPWGVEYKARLTGAG